MSQAVTADIPYIVNTGETLVNETFGPENISRRRTGTQELRPMTVRDGRPLIGEFSLDQHGFVFVEHNTRVGDFFDEQQLKSVYYPEVERLIKDGRLGQREISRLSLYDVVPPVAPAGAKMPVKVMTGDLPAPGETDKLMADKPDVVFHLAAIVSGEAEQDFDKGYRINLDGSRNLFESARRAGHKPRVVFTSSIAAFGAPFPEIIPDDYVNTPLTSYGTQKVIGELLLSDYTRKGFLDGVGIRLPTICIRPGKPNKAASGFFSNIMREPLAGAEAILPVSDGVEDHAVNAPRVTVVGGPQAEVDELEGKLKAEGVVCRRLVTSHAFHSAMMDPVVSSFRTAIERRPLAGRWRHQQDGQAQDGRRAEDRGDEGSPAVTQCVVLA